MLKKLLTYLIKFIREYIFCNKYNFISEIKPYIITTPFREYISENYLMTSFKEKFLFSNSKGIDGKSSYHIKLDNNCKRMNDIKRMTNLIILNKYKFSSYQEILITKGRNKFPRIVAKPTIQDKIILYALKEYFKKNIKNSITKQPNEVIDKIIHEIKDIDNFDDIVFYKTDIVDFYGSINRGILLKKIGFYLNNEENRLKICNLIKDIINSPIIPFGTKNINSYRYFTKKGIPQGLSLSNILANLYMFDIDSYYNNLVLEKKIIGYHRYVDDILIISKSKYIKTVKTDLESKMINLELSLHKGEKTEIINMKKSIIVFLGYVFKYKDGFNSNHLKLNNLLITPRKESLESFLKSIMALFSKYKNNILEIKKLKDKNGIEHKLNLALKNFIFRLNIKIAGCISNDNGYGFFIYFSKTTSPYYAYKLKSLIQKEIIKLFNNKIIDALIKAELELKIKDPISSYYSTQNKKFFKRNVMINYDEYMNYQEYVINNDNNKKSPEVFIKEYDSEYYEKVIKLYEGFELRKIIYKQFNMIKTKNLDLLNKDVSKVSSNR